MLVVTKKERDRPSMYSVRSIKGIPAYIDGLSRSFFVTPGFLWNF